MRRSPGRDLAKAEFAVSVPSPESDNREAEDEGSPALRVQACCIPSSRRTWASRAISSSLWTAIALAQ